MADKYVDLVDGSDSDNGDGPDPADGSNRPYKTFQKGLTDAGAGGRVFVQIDFTDLGSAVDTVAAGRTLTSPGSDDNPTFIYGIKNAVTNTPPVDADLLVRGSDTLPVYQATGAGSDIGLAGRGEAVGIQFDAVDRFQTSGTTSQWVFNQCEIKYGGRIYVGTSDPAFIFNDCELLPSATGAHLRCALGGVLQVNGGSLNVATSPTNLIGSINVGVIILTGVDLSAYTGNLVNLTSISSGYVRFINCGTNASATEVTGSLRGIHTLFVEFLQTSSETGLGAGESVRDYSLHTNAGNTVTDIVVFRTNGSNDGTDGAYSFALTPNVNKTTESSSFAVVTPWIGGVVEGDASTSKIFTLFIANSGASDYNKDDVWMEVLTPGVAGTALYDFSTSPRDIIGGATNVITDDTGSTWESGGNNHQKLQVTITPDYVGPVYARAFFAKRFGSSPETLYVDGLLDISDA